MTDGPSLAALAAKIDRLDSHEQIRQLACRYALAVDMRNLDALVSLYVDDIAVAGIGGGRAALKRHFDRSLRAFTGACHHIGNHVIEFEDDGRALGLVYGRSEHEVGEAWVHMQMLYLDTYERRGGTWYFARQRFLGRWYAAAPGEAPTGTNKVRWPGRAPADGPFHAPFPSYQAFLDVLSTADEPVVDVPRDRFLRIMLRGRQPAARD